MSIKSNKSIISQFTITGFLLGLLFPIIAVIIEMSVKGLSFSLQNIAFLYQNTPTLWIINSAPVIIAITGYLIGMRFAGKNSEILKGADKEKKKAEHILLFTEKLAQGNIDVQYDEEEQEGLGDEIAQSLVKLRDHLRKSKEEEELRKKEEYQRSWANEGLAKFSEIARQNNDDLQALSYNIISNLVNYLDAKLGGVFLLNDENPDDKHFELTACYAFNRKKYLNKRIEWEEGLIGACAIEKETTYLTDIPDEHIKITSGLGETRPRALLLVPLIVNEEVHGVLEIASLNKFETYQISFVEKLAETLASVISSVKINLHTAKLLQESQEKEKKLRVAEEEMRNNLEELNIAKEEAARQGEMLANFTNAVNHTLVRAEYNTDGVLLYANTRFLNKLGYSSNKEVEGQHISIFINEKDKQWFFKIWDELAKGGKHFEGDMKHVTKQGHDFWSMATYTCVRNPDGTIEKILFLGIDITEQKKQNLDYEGQVDALNMSNLKASFDATGRFMDSNKKFLDTLNLIPQDIKEKGVFDLLKGDFLKDIRAAWKNILNGIPHECQLKYIVDNNNEKWLHGTFTAVNDMYGEVAKVIYLASDITERKLIEIENIKKTEQLLKQEEQLINQQEQIKKQHEDFKKQTEQNIKAIKAEKERNEKTLEGALDAIVTMNHNEEIELFNKAAEELWKVSKRDVLGKNIRVILPPPYSESKDGEVTKFLQSPDNHLTGRRTEVNIVDKNGEEIPILLTLSGVKIGNEYTYTAFIQNISVELF
ncbi:MAG: PAS domain S-box protein [Bacteroidales bacterium]